MVGHATAWRERPSTGLGPLDRHAAMGYGPAITLSVSGRGPRRGSSAPLNPRPLGRGMKAIASTFTWSRQLLLGCALLGAAACGGVQAQPTWPPHAQEWFERGEASYRTGDLEDARLAADNAVRLVPNEEKVRLLVARIALADLDFAAAIKALEGMPSSEAAGLRGRALWYSGELERAADELERLIADPQVRDPWAVEVAKLARRGAGRKPFEISGGMLAVTEMPRVQGSAMVVPLEVDGEPALAMLATSNAEVVIDALPEAKRHPLGLRRA